jgi:hypothetical protein
MGIAYSPQIITDGLVLCLDAANPKSYPGSGSTWFDLSGNGNNGTNSNITHSASVAGEFFFNNSSSVSTIPNSASLNPTTGVTIESWVNFSGNDDDFIFEKGNVNTQYSLFSHGGVLNDIMFRTYHEGDGSYHNFSVNKTTVGISIGNWYHIVGSWNGSTKRIFVNGVQVGSIAKSGNLRTTTPGASVGRFGGTTTGYYWGGYISKIGIYSRGITATEVTQNFAALRGRFGI